MKRLLTIVLALAASPAAAQHFEIAPLTMAAFTTAARLEAKTVGVQQLQLANGFTYGAQVDYLLSSHMAVEGMWTWQDTGIKVTNQTGSAILFYMDVSQFDGNFVYTFGPPTQAVRPFVFGGLGANFMSAADLDTESNLAVNLGAGVKWFFHRHLGVRVDGRYKPTRLDSASSDYCNVLSFCQKWLRPFQIDSAMVLRF